MILIYIYSFILFCFSSFIYASGTVEVHNADTVTSQIVTHKDTDKSYMVTGGAIVGLLKEMVNFDIDGSGIVFHRKTGKLFVKNTPQNHLLIQDILKKMRSHKHRQVLIETRIIEVYSFKGVDIGVDWDKIARNGRHGTAGSLNFAPGSWGETPLNPLNQLNLSYKLLSGANALDITLKALEKDGKINTLSSPKIICFNNQRANIKIEESTDYVSKLTSNTVYTNNNSNVHNSADIDTAVEGIVLDVTPTINTDEQTITLDLHPSVVELVSLNPVNLGRGGTIRVPKYIRRSADTTVSLKDGGTVVLGGLVKRTQSDEIKKVPVLGEIPIIKNLFRSKTTYEKKSNLIIFITAKIIDL